MRSRRRHHVHGFEQIGLALRIVALDHNRAGRQVQVQMTIVAEVGQDQTVDMQDRPFDIQDNPRSLVSHYSTVNAIQAQRQTQEMPPSHTVR